MSFCTQVGVGIWLVPYLIHHLGVAAYGLIALAGILTEYVSLISHSISAAVNRFLTIALQQDDLLEANQVFSTAFFSYLAIGLLQAPLFYLLIWYVDTIINIPAELHRDMIILLVCSAVTFVVNLLASVFSVPMYANNRLDILRIIDIGRYLLRVGGIVTLFIVFKPALRYVGYVYLTISLIVLISQVLISSRMVPVLELGLRYYDWSKIRCLLGMGGWLLINNIGTLLFLRTDVWVCNHFVGPVAAGEFASLLQWPTLIRSGGAIIATLAAPMIMIYYARKELGRVVRVSQVSVRVLSLAISVPIGIMCAFSSPLLLLWLGDSFTHLAPLMVIMLFHLVINVGVVPLFNIQVAMNKVRLPAIVTLLMGALNLSLAITFVTLLDWGVYGVAIAGAVVLTAKNAIWTPIYTAWIMCVPWHTFMKPYFSALGLFMVVAASVYAISRYISPDSWLSLVLFSAGLGAMGFAAAWVILPGGDRCVMRAMLPGRFGKMAKN